MTPEQRESLLKDAPISMIITTLKFYASGQCLCIVDAFPCNSCWAQRELDHIKED
ncbi:MAG: hypothetical protein GY804_02500 [Alphaproteobacteria bacterium]|nr:hypothetical protein [Alphaproteobacteria bacterium]